MTRACLRAKPRAGGWHVEPDPDLQWHRAAAQRPHGTTSTHLKLPTCLLERACPPTRPEPSTLRTSLCSQWLAVAEHLILPTLRVEYAERGNAYSILFMFSLLCEHIDFEYVRFQVIYRVN